MDYKVEAGDLSERVKRQVGAIGEGHLEVSGIYDYDTAKTYFTIPVTLPLGHDAFGAVLYYNDTASPLEMTCMCEFIDPDGVSRGRLTDVETVGAGSHKTATTDCVTLNKNGTWKLHATLNGVEETWDAIQVGGKIPWMWIGIGGGAVAAVIFTVALIELLK